MDSETDLAAIINFNAPNIYGKAVSLHDTLLPL